MTVSSAAAIPRFAALHVADYRRYFLLGLLAMTADNIEHVISYWVIYLKFHSPALVDGTLKQPRLLSGSPRTVGATELAAILHDSLRCW